MAQPNKGPRRLIKTARIPEYVVTRLDVYAAENGLSLSTAVADLVASGLGLPLPSRIQPRQKNGRGEGIPDQEELPLKTA